MGDGAGAMRSCLRRDRARMYRENHEHAVAHAGLDIGSKIANAAARGYV